MKTKFSVYSGLLAIVLFFACSRSVRKNIEVDPAFGAYISAYTAGNISKASTIRIRLASDYAGEIKLNEPLKEELFSFEPALNGKTYWIDSRTIEFVPEKHMSSGSEYIATFHLGKLLKVPSRFEAFKFDFKTHSLGVFVKTEGLATYNAAAPASQNLKGTFQLTDVADTSKVKKLLHASQNGKDLKVLIDPAGDNRYHYTVHNIVRSSKDGVVTLSWNGTPLHAFFSGEKKIPVPALGKHEVTDISVQQEPEQFVKIHFSDPLDPNQTFTGLVTVQNAYALTYVVDGHDLFVFPSSRISGPNTVTVFPGIKNVNGKATAKEKTEIVNFEAIKPNVRIPGKGVIIPNTSGTILPFEAVNVKSVDVNVIQIFENNVMQFLQVNALNGDAQMKRVGKNIAKKTIRLDGDDKVNLHEWNRFSLDISNIVKVQPGAIYNIEISIKQEYSVYECGNAANPESNMASLEAPKEEEWSEDGWGSFNEGYYYEGDYYDDYYYEDYDYSQRENPCSNSYYSGKTATRNVLASDIGIIAKAGADKQMHVIVSDIRNTNPLVGVKLDFYDFQKQKIGSVNTGKNGMAKIKLKSKPFLVIAKKDKQRGYLTLRDGEALSLSKFDVGGETAEKGVKGFIYGERGVWRPGDSLYLSFMLEDKEKVLPPTHPVTMEIINPSGVTVQKMVRIKHVNGLYSFRTATQPEDPTGYWTAKVNVGNREFSKTLRIETVKPNRLKIYLDFGKNKLSELDETNTGKISAKWLHGAPARDLNAQVDVTLNQDQTSFSKFKDYNFDDPTRRFSAAEQTIFNAPLDENGEASFDAQINAGTSAPGMLKAHFTTRVFEKGGDFSIDRFSLTYSPYTHYVGIKTPEGEGYNHMLETDKDHTVNIATVDADGKPVSRQGIEVKVYKVEHQWWWDSYDNDITTYIANNGIVPHQTEVVNTVNGKGWFKLRVNRPAWGRFLILVRDPESRHQTGQHIYIDWPYYARANRQDPENATMLSFSTDKESYKKGEKVKVTIPSPAEGRALISIETGTRIVKKAWVQTKKGETTYEFTATEDMAPTAYVNVTLVQPHSAAKNDLPIRLYGVVPVNVENEDSHLNPVITCPSVLKPETTASISIKEKDGKPMTYTLAIVDEGLLDLTSFKTPDPWNHFYAREALGVKTWDLYDMVLGSYASKMDQLLAIGGDAEGEGKKGAKATRFKPMVVFAGPFELKGGTKTHQIKIPNYVGSVRVMVVAGQDRAYGHAEKTVPVRNPLMVLATMPRVIGPGETISLPVNVFAMEDHVKNVTVELTTNDFFIAKDGKKKSITFKKKGDDVVSFELDVANKLGVGKVSVVARSGKEIAKHEIEIDVRASNPKVTDVYEGVVDAGKSWNTAVAVNGYAGSNSVTVEVSTIPPLNLGERLKYLVGYPHGCIEQTTSGAFPQLYLGKLMELDDNFKKEITSNVNAAIKRIGLFQVSNGGFSYWPGSQEVSEWGTNYAAHFLLEAEAAGYKVPSGLKASMIKYLQNSARNYRVPANNNIASTNESYYGYYQSYDELTQSYRLFVLALAKSPDLGAMNRLREYTQLSATSKWRLAVAYHLAGQNGVAKKLISGLSTQVNPYTELSNTFGNDVRDKAMILEALTLMGEKTKAAPLAKQVSKELNADKWMSTQTTAYCLIGLSKFSIGSGSSREMNFAYSLGNLNENAKTANLVYQKNYKGDKFGKQAKFNIKNSGKNLLYVKVAVTKIPMTGDSSAVANNVNIKVNYVDMNGNALDVTKIAQGTDFIAEVSVTNPGSRGFLSEMALNQIFPGGWEIHNSRMDEFQSAVQTDVATYRDYRDDRVYSYYNIGANSAKVFRVKLNAAYVGRYYLPTVSTEAMYDNSIHARQPGKWVEVVKADKSLTEE